MNIYEIKEFYEAQDNLIHGSKCCNWLEFGRMKSNH